MNVCCLSTIMKPKKSKDKRKTKFPPSAAAFYIKLYCARRKSSKAKYDGNLITAAKSWLSLNETEKQQFHQKYKECEEKYKTKLFDQLKNAEPFMKLKDTSSDYENSHISSQNKTNENNIEEVASKTEEQIVEIETSEEFIPNNEESSNPPSTSEELLENAHDEQEENNEILSNINNEQQTILIEPLPPTIKTGSQLYFMLNSTDVTNNTLWTSLSTLERSRYSRAVSIMKKDYISKYKEYLESLSAKDLFDHYNKTIT